MAIKKQVMEIKRRLASISTESGLGKDYCYYQVSEFLALQQELLDLGKGFNSILAQELKSIDPRYQVNKYMFCEGKAGGVLGKYEAHTTSNCFCYTLWPSEDESWGGDIKNIESYVLPSKEIDRRAELISQNLGIDAVLTVEPNFTGNFANLIFPDFEKHSLSRCYLYNDIRVNLGIIRDRVPETYEEVPQRQGYSPEHNIQIYNPPNYIKKFKGE